MTHVRNIQAVIYSAVNKLLMQPVSSYKGKKNKMLHFPGETLIAYLVVLFCLCPGPKKKSKLKAAS